MITTTTAPPSGQSGPSTISTPHQPNSPREHLQRELLALDDGHTVYSHVLGWPVDVDRDRRRINLVIDDGVGAVVVPEPLGTALTHALIQVMQPAAVLTSGNGRWVTIPTSGRSRGERLPADLAAARVRVLPDGARVLLPIPGRPSDDARWVVPPRPEAALPAHSLVVTLARRALDAAPA